MDLVDEQHIACFEVGQDRSHVPRTFQRRARGHHDPGLQLIGDDPGQRGLSEPRRTRQQYMVEGTL